MKFGDGRLQIETYATGLSKFPSCISVTIETMGFENEDAPSGEPSRLMKLAMDLALLWEYKDRLRMLDIEDEYSKQRMKILDATKDRA